MPRLNPFNWFFEKKKEPEMLFSEFFQKAAEQFPPDSISVVIERWRHSPAPVNSPIRYAIWSHLMECHCNGDTPEEAISSYICRMDEFLAKEKEAVDGDNQ